MGIIWRTTMPLLSTLAALVIIVHSAEEELERGYRRELRPRAVDTASYEQPWKAMDLKPQVQQSTRAEVWNESPEEEPTRRRPVRKRKRRPQLFPNAGPQERHQESIQGTYHNADHHDSLLTMETTRKRRKRPDIHHESTDRPINTEARPLRRRGLRRKRPTDYDEAEMVDLVDLENQDNLESYRHDKHLQSFSKYSQYDEFEDTDQETTMDIISADQGTKASVTEDVRDGYVSEKPDKFTNRLNTMVRNKDNMLNYNTSFGYEQARKVYGIDKLRLEAPEHESSSSLFEDNQDEMSKAKISTDADGREDIMIMLKKSKENGIVDPKFLRQILKKSNGSSLSEILQRHNLSLSDLLEARDEAISALNKETSQEPKSQVHDASIENPSQLNEYESNDHTKKQISPERKELAVISGSDEDTNEPTTQKLEQITDNTHTDVTENQEIIPRMSAKRRFPTSNRRKLRMRPMLNSTLKAKISRDLIALSTRKFPQPHRNNTKSREWKDIVPLMVDRSKTDDLINKPDVNESVPTTTDISLDTTIYNLKITNSSFSVANESEISSVRDNEVENAVITTTEATTTIIIEVSPAEINSQTERPKITPIVRPAANNSAHRRQMFNNKLKRKRLKQKTSTTETPTDDLMKNFLEMANLVSASQFIERTQKPTHTTLEQDTEFATELEDFMTAEPPRNVDGDDRLKSTRVNNARFTSSQANNTSTTEQSAKFEIEEILNDTLTSERLPKILRERNMTLSELLNHRERGSSHVHLADIFHNASKEPNPPEPFLTKSSIEPISKETYPLRAILEASTHETTTRASQADQKNYVNNMIVMDFGNNVNENGETIGIISLFSRLNDSNLPLDQTELGKDSDGTPYLSSITTLNATTQHENDTSRESRVLANNEDWDDLLTFMKERNISIFEEDLQALNKEEADKESSEKVMDADGLMMLEDLQHLQNFESNIVSGLDENADINVFTRRENLSEKPGILNKLPSNTKSVAIATAGILGLAAILFLLTYIAFKWKQQRDKLRNKLRKKESFCAGQIPSPVFENRKSHKNNCSSRSISPMISSTNIYMSTLDSHNGKESPEYAWNSLRKPFQ